MQHYHQRMLLIKQYNESRELNNRMYNHQQQRPCHLALLLVVLELSLRELAQKHKKLWAFNGQIGDYSTLFAEIDQNDLVSLDVYNDTAWRHAMHLHGHHFWVMSDDPTMALPTGQRDTWLMQPRERISLVFKADNPGLWLFHCHMLEHAASGMGAVLAID